MASNHMKSLVMSIALIALVVAAGACTRRQVVHVGSHKVTVLRHGFEKKFDVKNKDGNATLEYRGVSTDGKGLKVFIQGDKVRINDEDSGQLRPGDSVVIGDEGVAVNSLDYGESAKYLRANSAGPETSKLN